LHLPALGWIDDPTWAMPAVIIYSLWQAAGFNTIVFLAGLTNIPRELEEAARVDGSAGWAVARYVTLPLLTPTIFFVLTVASIESLKVFTQIFALTGGGPGGATTTVDFFLYQDAFLYFHLDVASAVAVILFVLIMAVTAIQWWISRRWVFYR
jgi:multiple sugar transport system permease protein